MARRIYASVTRAVLKVLNLKVKQKCKYSVTMGSKHRLSVAENVLDRQSPPVDPSWQSRVGKVACKNKTIELTVFR